MHLHSWLQPVDVRGKGCMILAGVAMPGGRLSPVSVVHATTGLSDLDGRVGPVGSVAQEVIWANCTELPRQGPPERVL